MLALMLALAFSAQTKLYTSGCAPIDTLSAVVPLAEFRQVIVNQETKISLGQELGVCLEIKSTLDSQVSALKIAGSFDSTAAANWKAAYDTANTNRLKFIGQLDAVAAEARKTGFKRGFWTGAGAATALYAVIAGGITWFIISVY
jgi:hypothetical protein